MEIIFQQLGIVVGHLLEVRHQPALVHRVTMEAAAELIVDAAPRHFFERGLRDEQQSRLAGGLIALQNQIERLRMREFRSLAESAVVRIESLQGGIDQRVHQPRVPSRRARPAKSSACATAPTSAPAACSTSSRRVR